MMELVRFGGRSVAGFSLGRSAAHPILGLGVWPGDLFAYRQEWEPFIAAHLALWRNINAVFEGTDDAKQCPAGIFDDAQIQNLTPTMRSFCGSLAITRMYISDTHPLGILTQWNMWKDEPSADVLAAAATMLKWHQDVVLRVGGKYKDDLIQIAKLWNLDITLPELPTFSDQQSVISSIEGAYVSTKGVLELIGYGAAGTLKMAADTTQAIADGLSDTALALPKVVGNPWTWIGITAALAVVGGALIYIYVPHHHPPMKA